MIIAGDGSERCNLESLSQKLGIDKFVTFVGSRNDIENVLNDCDIALLTSEFETFGLSAIEAMASGCVVVAYPPRGGLSELLIDRHNCVIAGQRTPASLAECIEVLLNESDFFDAIKIGGRNTALRYSSNEMTKRTLDFYSLLMASR